MNFNANFDANHFLNYRGCPGNVSDVALSGGQSSAYTHLSVPLMQHPSLHLSLLQSLLSASPGSPPHTRGPALLGAPKPPGLHGCSDGGQTKGRRQEEISSVVFCHAPDGDEKRAAVACSRRNNCQHLAALVEAGNDPVTPVQIYNIYCNSHE